MGLPAIQELDNFASTGADPVLPYIQAIAALIGESLWPSAAVIIVWVLREQIRELLGRLRQIEGRGLKAEFSRELESLPEPDSIEPPSNETEEAIAVADSAAPEVTRRHFDTLIAISPASAVLVAWRVIEPELIALAKRESRPDLYEDTKGFSPLVSWLTTRPEVPKDLWETVHKLYSLRNRVAHASPSGRNEVSEDQAWDYVAKCLWSAKGLRQAREFGLGGNEGE